MNTADSMLKLTVMLSENLRTGDGQYLKELVENAYTGYWAKEVAEVLLKNKDE